MEDTPIEKGEVNAKCVCPMQILEEGKAFELGKFRLAYRCALA